MKNKRQVFVTLHARGRHSLGEERERLGYAAYHWGILICPKNTSKVYSYAYDVSDGPIQHADLTVDPNPENNWVFREKVIFDFEHSNHLSSLIKRVLIGKIPHEVPYEEIRRLLEAIPLPEKGAQPEQNCVSWTREVIRTLQENGFAGQFDMVLFLDEALAHADQFLRRPDKTSPRDINYTRRPR